MPKQPAPKDLTKLILVPLAIIALLFLATFNLHSYLTRNVGTEVLSYETSLDEERIFWREFLSENPNYIPGWVEYAKINYQLNNFDEASLAVEEIEKIDPNYVVSLEEYLN
jgi:hypothetical protein